LKETFFFSAQKRISKAVTVNFGLKDPRAARVMERKKIIFRPILETWTGFWAKSLSSGHMGICIKERNIHLLEYTPPYRHMQRMVSFTLSLMGNKFC